MTPRFRYLGRLDLRDQKGRVRTLEVGIRLRGPTPRLRSAGLELWVPAAGSWERAVSSLGGIRVGTESIRNPSRTRTLALQVEAQGKFEIQTGIQETWVMQMGGGPSTQSQPVRYRAAAGAVLSGVRIVRANGSVAPLMPLGSRAVMLAPGEEARLEYWVSAAGAARCPLPARGDPLSNRSYLDRSELTGFALAGSFERSLRWSDAEALAGESEEPGSEPSASRRLEITSGKDPSGLPQSRCQGIYST